MPSAGDDPIGQALRAHQIDFLWSTANALSTCAHIARREQERAVFLAYAWDEQMDGAEPAQDSIILKIGIISDSLDKAISNTK